MNRKVLLRAYVAGNLGDDLFVKVICERYPNTNFILIGDSKYMESFSCLKNLNYISFNKCSWFHPYELFRKLLNQVNKLLNKEIFFIPNYMNKLILSHAKKVDANVLISGSYFINDTTNRRLIDERISLEKRYFKNAPYVIGVNFGPFVSDYFYHSMKEIFKNAKLISFRESYSYNLFQDLTNIQMAPDIVFSGSFNSVETISDEDLCTISICKYSKDPQKLNAYINSIIKSIHFLLNRNMKVVLLGMCEKQGDHDLIYEIIEKGNFKDKVKVISYPTNNQDECISYIKNSSFVIATRYHAVILGWMFNKQLLPLVYSKKISNVLKDEKANLKYIYCDDLGSVPIEDYLSEIFLNPENALISSEEVIRESNRHFKLLDSLLNE